LNKYKFSPLCEELYDERDKIGDVYMRKSAGVWGWGTDANEVRNGWICM
jgi:hypothetical protein